MTTLVRFAPSPTGFLHVGNVRTGLMNMLFALKTGGRFLLRIDDTDTERSTKEYEDAIRRDLAWMGFAWDLFARQSERLESYEAAAENLKASGRLYPCYETPDELERRRKRALAQGKPPIYDRAALKLTDADRAKLEAEGKRPHWRFKLTGHRVEWTDLVRGPVHIDTASVSDPVLVREDGRFLYTLPSVVDDIDFAVTHVIRGEDHVTNTGVQVEIIEALGGGVPAFAHLPLLTGPGGEALSKRLGSLGVDELRREGILPMAIASLLAKLGTSDPVQPRFSLAELAAEFDFAKIGRAPAHFDRRDLLHVNARLMHAAPFADVAPHLKAMALDPTADEWRAIHDNLETLKDAAAWLAVMRGPIAPEVTDAGFLGEAAALLPQGELGPEAWGAWTRALAERTGRKGKELYHPLRLALTGRPHGPEMKTLLPLIGRERALARLAGRTA